MNPEVLALGGFSEPTRAEMRSRFTLHHFDDAAQFELSANAETFGRIVAIGNEPNRHVTAQLMDKLPNLRVISVCGMGTDAIDLQAAAARNIAVTITPNVLGDEVGDFAIGLMLASARMIIDGDRFVREGKWLEGRMKLGRSVGGKTMGVVGLGGIGRAIADRGASMKMNVLYNGPRHKPDAPYTYIPDIVELARLSDYLMVACKGGPDTVKLVSADVIKALGPTGTLVNVSRGTVVDEKAMIHALQTGALGFAALDVFENEPHVDPALLTLPNVIIQPHQASATLETRSRMGMAMIENIFSVLANEPAATRAR